MPNVNLTDSRKRDAVVKAESTGVAEDLRYVDSNGNTAYTRKILKATVEHDYATLVERYGDDPEKLGLALVDGDPEVDMEKCGVYLWGVSKVYVNSDDGIVYRIQQTEVVRDPEGKVKEKRARQRSEANVDMEVPLTWTGQKFDKNDAIRRFVFSSKLQIVHINGLTYDFLYGMASELAESNSMMMIGGGGKGRDPLIFRSGSIPYRGFLEGRVDGEKYILLLHLSNMELKQIGDSAESTAIEETTNKVSDPKKNELEKNKTKDVEKTAETNKIVDADPVVADDSGLSEIKEAPTETEVEVAKAETQKKEDKQKPAAKKSKVSTKAEPEPTAKTIEIKEPEGVVKSAPDVTPDQQEQVNNQDLGVWLKSIRMGKYLAVFIENEIDVDVLSELTDDDLKELEIPLGSRRRLLKAVAEADNLRAEVAMAVQTMSGVKSSSKK